MPTTHPTDRILADLATGRHHADVYRQLLDAAAELAAGLSAQLEAAREERDTAESVTARAVADTLALRASVASLTAERDGATAQDRGDLAAYADAANREIAALRAEVASYRAAAVGVAAALGDDGGLGPIDSDPASFASAFVRFAESLAGRAGKVAAEVAELRARPSLTVERLAEAIRDTRDVSTFIAIETAKGVMAKLGPVTLPTPDAAEELIAAYVDEFATRYEEEGNPPHMDRWHEVSAGRRRLAVETMTAALAKLTPATGEPARVLVHADGGDCHGWRIVDGRCVGCGYAPDMQSTSLWPVTEARSKAPAVAPGALVAVSDEDLAAAFRTAWNQTVGSDTVARLSGIRAVRALLGAKLIAPVDPEAVARTMRDHAAQIGLHPREPVDYLDSLALLVRQCFTAHGIPVTPEAVK